MARLVRNTKIDTRSSRAKLPARQPLYWITISPNCALGFYKGKVGGKWQARLRDGARLYFETLGAADDVLDADGVNVLNFQQAQEKAREFFRRKGLEISGEIDVAGGPFTVADAMEDYFRHKDRQGAKGVDKDRSRANVHILPTLGDVEVAKLTSRRLRDWHTAISEAPRIAKKGRFSDKAKVLPTGTDPEAVRARRASSNRILTVIKAALNHAFHEGRVASDDAWRKVKPFREADAPIVRHLSPDEITRLINTCEGQFRHLIRGALLTGARYGELCRLAVRDYHRDAGTVSVQLSKAGKPRHIALTDEGRELFDELTAGKTATDRIFVRDDGKPWGISHQARPLEAASIRAKVEPTATFHILRHTYASALAMAGTPMGVIAAQLGHADTRMTERHYAHLAPNYVATTIRANLPKMGGGTASAVTSLKLAK